MCRREVMHGCAGVRDGLKGGTCQGLAAKTGDVSAFHGVDLGRHELAAALHRFAGNSRCVVSHVEVWADDQKRQCEPERRPKQKHGTSPSAGSIPAVSPSSPPAIKPNCDNYLKFESNADARVSA